MKHLHLLIPAVLCATALQAQAETDPGEFAVGGVLGTRGVGVDTSFRLNEKFNLRGSLAGFQYSEVYEESGNEYDGDLDLLSMGLLVDWFPFHRGLRLSAGAYYNGNKLTAMMDGGADGTVEIGDSTYNVAGQYVRAEGNWDAFAPYLGIGWGNPLVKESGLSFTAELGVMFTSQPEISLLASEVLMADLDFRADLLKEEAEVQAEVDDLKFWPVLQIGVNYNF